MDVWYSLMGEMEVELVSAAPEELLDCFSRKGLELRKIRIIDSLTVSFWISRKIFPKLRSICKKRGASLQIKQTRGLGGMGKRFRSRALLLIGGSLLMALVMWLPSRVLFVQVDGNVRIPTNRILESAEICGITFGASRRDVRSERVKNALLEAVPELRWAGVNTSGCTAIISVRERPDLKEVKVQGRVASIEAARDGYILSCTVTRGNPLVKPGQSVKAGQILISAYTDCGLSIRAEQAEGEVFAQTCRSLQAVTPSQFVKKGTYRDSKWKISLRIRKKRINLWKDSGIWDDSCGRMYEEYYITLPGGFQLPAALCVERYDCRETFLEERSEEEGKAALESFSRSYLYQHMVSGEILRSSQNLVSQKGWWCLNGVYICSEMIGKVQQEQIGDTNGKNS